MNTGQGARVGRPDPRRIVTRHDFGAELTLARQASGLSVRQVASRVAVPASTVGGYFAGTHLPGLQPPGLLERILRLLGTTDPADLTAWRSAYWRLRQAGGSGGDDPRQTERADPLVPVSIRPPVERLALEPSIRGRDELLQSLESIVLAAGQAGPPARVHVLHGLSGSGKSTVALAAARTALHRQVRTFWIQADDGPSTAAGMRALAVELGVPMDQWYAENLPDGVWRCLEALDEPWLLVFDNADDPPASLALPRHGLLDGTGWLRPTGRASGTIIVTTRDGSNMTWHSTPPPWLTLHRLGGLHRDDAAEVLRELAGSAVGTHDDAAALAERLGGLPLALNLVGRYLNEADEVPPGLAGPGLPRTYTAYLEALTRGDAGPMPGRSGGTFASRTSRTGIDQAWDLSLSLLAERGLAHAKPLLQLLACLGATVVPYGRLLRAETLAGSSLFTGMQPLGTWEALRALEGLGLITMSGRDDAAGLTMHPLVRDTVRADPDLRRHAGALLHLTTALLEPAIGAVDPKSPATWSQWRLLADHCTAPLDLLEEQAIPADLLRAAVRLAHRAASFLRAAGHRGQAGSAFDRTLAAAHRCLGDLDQLTLTISHDLARLDHDRGRAAEAEERFRAVLAARRDILGDEHPDTLHTQYYLARTLRARGALDEAEKLLASTLAARTRLLGTLHPDTLTSRHGSADLLKARDRLPEALAAYQEVLAQRQQVLGEAHPATMVTRQHLAEVYQRLDQLDLAEREFRWLWENNQRVRGTGHPRTLAVGQSLVEVLHDRGAVAAAADLGRTVAQARRDTLGDAHPATLASRYRLALIQVDQGDVVGARRELTAVLADRQHVLGVDHPHTGLAHDTLVAVGQRTTDQAPHADRAPDAEPVRPHRAPD
ncbi:tetratricopeptide repeat protein [Solwaraspora sp. WMMA2065]|uniref:tetratricopeptide repeat protein n=1 Tax=Solwaraspora sp. WMMA2065 TaxID=3015166 RepID=UPI00259B25CB|nr:tetratricopeptide repeat protein [Solwaraspora sp. WMMA2065]WJK33077.1 tetratricopeptide repeat protein [Solwaraspora sp. WMMA2065]